MNTTNRNLLWASIFVDEIIRAGVRFACMAPGSRSTPLVFAFAERPELKKYSLLDERGAAFFCLGLGLAGSGPAALLCTSGTAAANFLPAVIEASQSEVPMLVLTADRPAELRHSGANQTIDQVKLYGSYVRWFVEIPAPEPDPSAHLLASLRTTADRAVAVALGLGGAPGPVHLNFPFRKPLEPTPHPADLSAAWQQARATEPSLIGRAGGQPFVQINGGKLGSAPAQIDSLATRIKDIPEGLIVCGPRCPDGGFADALIELGERSAYPILADALSGLRFGPHPSKASTLSGYETFLSSEDCRETLPTPRLVLRFGDLPISAALGTYLARLPASVTQIAIGSSNRWTDDMFTLGEVVHAHALDVCAQLNQHLVRPANNDFATAWNQAEAATWQTIQELRSAQPFEGAILSEVLAHLPDGADLYVANSLPIRHLDQFAATGAQALRVFANRGASGIDGTISTALGIAAASGRPLVLVTGDLSLYHDLNGLVAFKRCGVSATVVLIHNDGGGIFQRLPAAQFDPGFTEFILTPHGLDFAPAAQMFGVEYRLLNDLQALGPALLECVGAPQPHLLAIHTDTLHGEQARRNIIAEVSKRLREHK